MTKEHQGSGNSPKPASEAKNARRSTARLSGKRGCYRPRARNDLYALAAQFKSNHPNASGLDAWRHFTALAGISPVVVAYSPAMDVLEYVPDLDRFASRTVTRRAFLNRWYGLAAS